MRKFLIFISLALFGISCSHVHTDDDLPQWEVLTIENMATQLPIVHIEADKDRFDYMTEYHAYPIPIASKIEMWNENKDQIINQNAIIEIRGVGSAEKPMKPFGIEFSNVIDNSSAGIISPKNMAPGDDLSKLISFRVRNSSQDYGVTMLKDLAYTEMAIRAGFDLELKYGRPVHVFVNSEYYGLQNLRTEVDQKALALMLNIDSAKITTIKMDNANHNLEYREGNEILALEFIRGIKERNLEVIEQYLDIDNYMDYIIYEDYIGNAD